MPVSRAQYRSITLYAVLLYTPALTHHSAYAGFNLRYDDEVMQLTRSSNYKEGHEQVPCFHTTCIISRLSLLGALSAPGPPYDLSIPERIQGC